MTQVIRALTRGIPNPDIRELISHRESMTAAHLSGDYSPSVAEILANYDIDEALTEPPPKVIVLFDDILTAGSHFKAAKLALSKRFPSVRIVGVFIARRIFSATENI